MIKPEDFKSSEELIDDVNLKKLEEMTDDERLEYALKCLRAARAFHKDGPRYSFKRDECGVDVGGVE